MCLFEWIFPPKKQAPDLLTSLRLSVDKLIERAKIMNQASNNLAKEVEETKQVAVLAVNALMSLKTQLAEAMVNHCDPVMLQKAADDLDAVQAQITAALASSAPAPAPDPAEDVPADTPPA